MRKRFVRKTFDMIEKIAEKDDKEVKLLAFPFPQIFYLLGICSIICTAGLQAVLGLKKAKIMDISKVAVGFDNVSKLQHNVESRALVVQMSIILCCHCIATYF